MNRGKALQPDKDCEYCGKQLLSLRHPNAKYCDSGCRQRDRYQKEHDVDGLKCLDCGKIFTRVGSHVVQVHGYGSTTEYRKEHGLMAKETRLQVHADMMREKATTFWNLEEGSKTRYKKGGNHGERVSEFWENRKQKLGYEKLHSNLRGNIRI
jgi:hypothetical protein